LGCYGDGGAVFTDDDDIAESIKSFRIHGKGKDKYDNVKIGINSRLDTIQAAILIPKFKAFVDYELERINKIAQQYTQLLSPVVITPTIPEGFYSSWAQYTVIFESQDKRDCVQEKLKKSGVPSMVYYSKPMHLQSAFKELTNIIPSDYPSTERLCDCVLSLPIHPYLTDDELHKVVDTILLSC